MTESKHEMEILLDQYRLRAMPEALREKLAHIAAAEAKPEKRFPAVFFLVAMAACALAGVLYFVQQPDNESPQPRPRNMIADEETVERRKPDLSKGEDSHYFRGNPANNAFFEGALGKGNKAQKTLYFAGMVLYESEHTLLVAVDIENGKIEWSAEFSFRGPSPLVVADGTLYVGFDDGYFAAVDALTGEELWRFENDNNGFREAPIVHDGMVYVGGLNHCLYALSAPDGRVVWSVGSDEFTGGDWGGGCFSEGMLYTVGRAGNNGGVVVLDGQTGKREAGLLLAYPKDPVVVDGFLFCKLWEKLSCVDLDSKETKWTATLPEGSYSHPAIEDGLMVAGSRDRNLYAFSLATGRQEWVTTTTSDLDYAPVISDGRVFICRRLSNGLSAFDLQTGKLLWGGDQLSTVEAPVVLDGKVYVINESGFQVYDAKTGAALRTTALRQEGSVMRGWYYPCIAN